MSGPAPRVDVGTALEAARAGGVDRLDAQLLLAWVLQRPRTWLLAHGDDTLGEEAAQRFHALVERRAAGEPVAYLLGEKEFFGLTLKVDPAVLVPRPDTETIVEWALALLSHPAGKAANVLDLGTGSGAIALAIARNCPAASVTAVDASEAALVVAAANGRALSLGVQWQRGHWFDTLGDRRFDLIVANPPYVAEGDPHLDALRHEPREALVSGPDGLDALRAIVAQAPQHLAEGGWLLLEHGHEQAAAVAALLVQARFTDVVTRRDLAGRPRCTGARRTAGVHKGAEART